MTTINLEKLPSNYPGKVRTSGIIQIIVQPNHPQLAHSGSITIIRQYPNGSTGLEVYPLNTSRREAFAKGLMKFFEPWSHEPRHPGLSSLGRHVITILREGR